MSERPLDPALTDLERALGALAPVPAALDRDRLLFEAGRRAARRRGWYWPGATAALALLAAGLGTALVLRAGPPPVERMVSIPAAQPTPSPDPEEDPPFASRPNYFRLREQLLTRGLEALPVSPPAPPAGPPVTLENLLREPELATPAPRHPGL
jgi:hypothetical protein